MDASKQQTLPPGYRLEEFEIVETLGRGGFGITYRAWDRNLEREVVIKENLPLLYAFRDPETSTVHPLSADGEDADADMFLWSLESFVREARTLAKFDHRNIVKVLRVFEANGTAYFVMPHVEGESFDRIVKKREKTGAPFRQEEIERLLLPLLDVLELLHASSVFHRDIKPANILVTAAGRPVLIDFGAARQRISERSLTVVESAGYTPLEQLQSRGNVGPWSDLYGLAGTFYKAIAFETPPKAADRALRDPIRKLAASAEWTGRHSPALLQVMDRALALNYEERPQSVGEMRAAMLAAGPGMTRAGKAPPLPETPQTAQKSATFVALRGEKSQPEPSSPPPTMEKPARGTPRVEPGEMSKGKVVLSRRPASGKSGSWLGWVVAVVAPILGFAVLLWSHSDGGGSNSGSQSKQAVVTAGKAKEKETLQPLPPAPRPPAARPPATVPPQPAPADSNPTEMLRAATVENPFVNTLGMRFVPVVIHDDGQLVLFCEHETRVQDYAAYAAENPGIYMGWKDVEHNGQWQAPDHPLVNVIWEDAKVFCAWLTRKERAAGRIGPRDEYRLPTDMEWSWAVGIGDQEDPKATPEEKDGKIKGFYPWGTQWPPPAGAGNYGGQEASHFKIRGYRDNHRFTAPVKSYAANDKGLYDVGGNVWEWCEDTYDGSLAGARVLRGASWRRSDAGRLLSSYRLSLDPGNRGLRYGFRVVVMGVAR